MNLYSPSSLRGDLRREGFIHFFSISRRNPLIVASVMRVGGFMLGKRFNLPPLFSRLLSSFMFPRVTQRFVDSLVFRRVALVFRRVVCGAGATLTKRERLKQVAT